MDNPWKIECQCLPTLIKGKPRRDYSLEWVPDCDVHGVGSAWFNDDNMNWFRANEAVLGVISSKIQEE